jgi:hypothetical protein
VLGSFVVKGLFLLAIIVIGRSCGANLGRNAAERQLEKARAKDAVPITEQKRRTPLSHEDSYTDFIKITKGGLTMRVPKELSSLTAERSSGGQVQSLEKYTIVSTTRSFMIKHFIFKAPLTVSPSEAADMTEADIKSQPDYRATRRSFKVSGIEGIVLDAQYSLMGQKVEQSVLYFSSGDELWEIYLLGVNDAHPTALSKMKERVFTSIEINN